MKKILGAALVTAMVAFPMTAGAATQANVVVQPQVKTNVISPEYKTKQVMIGVNWSQFDYPVESTIPNSYWYSQDSYSGWLQLASVYYNNKTFMWEVTYYGTVVSYLLI